MTIVEIRNWYSYGTISGSIAWPKFTVELEVPTGGPYTLNKFSCMCEKTLCMLATVCRYPTAVFFIIISFFLSFKEVFTCILISPVPARAGVCDKVTTKDESHVGGACRPVSSGSSYMFSRACSASQTSVEDLVVSLYPSYLW